MEGALLLDTTLSRRKSPNRQEKIQQRKRRNLEDFREQLHHTARNTGILNKCR
jgi:hypothetical protein